MAFSMSVSDKGDGEEITCNNPAEAMAAMMGPGYADQAVRGAVQTVWMALPKNRRNLDEVEKEVHRLVARAISNLREDIAVFGEPK